MTTLPVSGPSEASGSGVKLVPTARGGVRIEVHAKPRSKTSRVVGLHGDALSVAVAAPPVDGAANAELIRFLADLFGVAAGWVTLVRGGSGRVKLFEVEGTDVEAMRQVLDDVLCARAAKG